MTKLVWDKIDETVSLLIEFALVIGIANLLSIFIYQKSMSELNGTIVFWSMIYLGFREFHNGLKKELKE